MQPLKSGICIQVPTITPCFSTFASELCTHVFSLLHLNAYFFFHQTPKIIKGISYPPPHTHTQAGWTHRRQKAPRKPRAGPVTPRANTRAATHTPERAHTCPERACVQNMVASNHARFQSVTQTRKIKGSANCTMTERAVPNTAHAPLENGANAPHTRQPLVARNHAAINGQQ